MGRYLLLAAVAAVATAGLVACTNETSTLGPGGYDPSAPAPSDSSKPANPGTKDNNPQSNNPAPAPLPQSGPGSKDSKARQNFIDNVFPTLSTTCGGCHSSGAAGAPKTMSSDASNTYQLFDQRGYIVATGSLLVSHKHTGAGTDPTTEQLGKINAWLALEGQERVGQKAPEDILAKVAKCINPADWKAAEAAMRNLRTVQRNGENANTCTGCANASCTGCHRDGGYSMLVGLQNDDTTTLVKQRPWVGKFIGTNGADPIPSDAVKQKGIATQTGAPYSHPKFTLDATSEAAIQKMATDAITAYKAGTCGP
jgi:hypothetical protein